MASDSNSRNLLELKFVDHYETKIQTPEKEKISPTKEVLNPLREENLSNSFEEHPFQDQSEGETSDKMSINKNTLEDNAENMEENDQDSGLDSSGNETGENETNEKFIDRQEDILQADMPDTLETPSKTLQPVQSTSRIVDELFNFIDEENVDGLDEKVEKSEQEIGRDLSNNNTIDVGWNLDAVNNNSEVIVKDDTEVLRSESKSEAGFILTAKTEPTPKVVDNSVQLIPDTPGDANMNLYWYSTNLELDPNEIQEFKNAQEGKEEPGNSSNGDEYYREKLGDYEAPRTEAVLKTDDEKLNSESGSVGTERWSPIYESASSRFLDLASELKSHPDEGKTNGNVSTENKTSEHPWGLETENKLLIDSENKHEELPVLEPKFHPIDRAYDTQDDTRNQPDDSTNMKVSFQVRKNVSLKQFDSNFAAGKPKEISETKIELKMKQTENNVDEADAVGYMEINDKDLIKAQEADVIESAPDKNVEMQERLSPDKQSENGGWSDQPDAIGLMEIVDRENIKATFEGTEYAQLSEKDMKNVDNFRKKSEEKIVIEQFEKCNVEDSQTVNVDITAEKKTDLGTVRDTINLNELEADIITDILGNRDMIDSPNKEIKEEISHKVESKIQKIDSRDHQVEKAKAVMLKLEPVEIRRKFKVSDDSLRKISSKGGQLLKTETFVDQYYDDSCYSLTLNDSWLRKRNEEFEMKTSCSALLSGGKVTVSDQIIVHSLLTMLHKPEQRITKTLPELIVDLDLSEFATFQTTRHYYDVDDCSIMLDLTDFGFQSGDIFITVDSPTKVPEAIQRIDKLAEDLGFQLLQDH